MKKQIQRYAGVLLASAVVIGGIASAANVDPIPTISNTFAISGQVIKSADINKLAEGLNTLDARTNNFKNNITVTDAGNVGVGTNAPFGKLDVQNGRTYLSADNEIYALGLRYKNNTQPYYIGASNSATASDLIFSEQGGTERMRLTQAGNVGIGTTTPTQKLEVLGGNIRINGTSGNPYLMINNASGDISYLQMGAAGALDLHTTAAGGDISFSAGGASRMNVKTNGNVGIGTTTPSEKLEVAGKIKSASTASTDAGSTVVTKDYLSNLPNPVSAQDAATKSYVDSAVAAAGGGGGCYNVFSSWIPNSGSCISGFTYRGSAGSWKEEGNGEGLPIYVGVCCKS